MADGGAYSGEADFRPLDLSAKQDQIIQLVAKYVSLSKDPARYQHKLLERTKHSPNFSFLDPSHRHHSYYQYLISSYTFWYSSSYGAQTDYSHYYGQEVPTVAGAGGSGDQNGFGYAAGAAAPVLPSGAAQGGGVSSYQGYDFSGVPMPTGQSSAPAANQNSGAVVRERTPDNDDDDEDEAPRFRFIVENGVRKAVPL